MIWLECCWKRHTVPFNQSINPVTHYLSAVMIYWLLVLEAMLGSKSITVFRQDMAQMHVTGRQQMAQWLITNKPHLTNMNFPKKPWFLRVCSRGSFENSVGKGEIARYEQFLLFPQYFLPFKRTFSYFYSIWNCRLQTLSKWKSLKSVVWERVKESYP